MLLREETKSIEVKDIDSAGKGKALLAVLADVDYTGDTYTKGAFAWMDGGEQWAMMIPHHNKQAMPFGKGRIYEDGGAAYADFELNLKTAVGRDWHEALKFDLETGRPAQQWSYGYRALEAHKELRGNRHVRVLDKLDVFEISPVLRGTGRLTGTIGIKSAELKDDAFAGLIGSLGDLAEAAGAIEAGALSATGRKQLAEIHEAIGQVLAPEVKGDPGADSPVVRKAIRNYMAGIVGRHIQL